MNLRKVVCGIAVVVPLLVSGCATFPDPANPNKTQGLADEIHDHLDKFTAVTVTKSDASGRLFRAYFLVAAFSVYGNASIERYSHSPAGDAGGLLGRIMSAEAALKVAMENEQQNYYPVDRTRLIFAIADLAAKAVRPTVTMGVGLIGTPPTPATGARLALDIFKYAVEDVLYGDAYLEGFRRSVCQLDKLKNAEKAKDCSAIPLAVQLELYPGAADKLEETAWKDLRDILAENCETLRVKARLAKEQVKCGIVGARADSVADKPAAGGVKPVTKPDAKPATG